MKAIILCALLLVGGCQQVTRTESPRGVTVRPKPEPERDYFAIARISPSDDWWSITSTRRGHRISDLEKGMARLIESENCKIQKIVPVQDSDGGRSGLKGYTRSLLVQCVPDRP